LSGVKAGLMMEIPGTMARGNWTAALFVDGAASVYAVKALTRIFTGRVGGSTHLLSILVGSFLGVHQVPILYRTDGETRIIKIDKIIDGAITPIAGKQKERNVVIQNSSYWIAPEIVVAPFARALGANVLIGTKLEYNGKGCVTGAFATPNCRGEEKVRRLRAQFGDSVRLAAAYGDTSGDKPMLKIADEKGYRVFKSRP